jgi:hypothetical protein
LILIFQNVQIQRRENFAKFYALRVLKMGLNMVTHPNVNRPIVRGSPGSYLKIMMLIVAKGNFVWTRLVGLRLICGPTHDFNFLQLLHILLAP